MLRALPQRHEPSCPTAPVAPRTMASSSTPFPSSIVNRCPRLRRGVYLVLVGLLIANLGLSSSADEQALPPTSPAVSAPTSQTLERLDDALFPVPSSLQPNVDFWTKVYSSYDNTTVLLHDERHMQVIYAAIDLSELMERDDLSEAQKYKQRRTEIRKVESKYKGILQDLAAGRISKDYPGEQKRVEALFRNVEGNRSKFTHAQSRLRTQTCLRNRFAEAIERSGYYLDTFEEHFQGQGLPTELTRLPFVESLFQLNAHSSAAAGGIWQFVPSTARIYMKMELEYDQRYDPMRATEAAAKLLSENFGALKTWPLAITAYNHGRYGMQRAVRRVGTRDLGRIAKEYRSRTFGFASRNFYASFIAAAQVYANRDHYFPGVEPFPLLTGDTFIASRYVDLPKLARQAELDMDDLKLRNPSLAKQIWNSHLYLPRGFELRVPKGRQGAVEAAFGALDGRYLSDHQVGFHYRVRPGDTLGKIASKYGSSVRAVQRANRLSSPNRIRVGQKLLIPPPPGRGGASSIARQPVPADGTYTVRPGDSLSSIAKRFGTSTQRLLAANRLSSPDRIYVGQRLQVDGSAEISDASRHVVRRGETLASIARRYGTSVRALQRANGISNHIIRPSQVLIIPQ